MTAVVHGSFIHALGPRQVNLHVLEEGWHSLSNTVLEYPPEQSTLIERTQTSSFSCKIY